MWKSIVSASILAAFGALSVVAGTQTQKVPDAVTPPELREGWAGDRITPVPAAAPLKIVGAASSEGAIVKLWDYERKVNGGNHLPVWRQETGDCVSMGFTRAINSLQCGNIFDAIAEGRAPPQYRPGFPPWIYGVGRTDPQIGNGRLGRSAGMVGEWAVRAGQLKGVIPMDTPGLPAYKGALADEWGRKPGPPQKWYAEAAKAKLGNFALVDSYEAARDALANRYPVTVASNQGFEMDARLIDGRYWGRPSGTWNHQMCFLAVDDTLPPPPWSRSKKKGGLWIGNSWGEKAHFPTAAPDGAPWGGFWVDRDTADKMLRQQDSYAVSLFEGFKAQGLDWSGFDSFQENIVADPGINVVSMEVPTDSGGMVEELAADVVKAPEQPVAEIPVSETVGVPRNVSRTAGVGGIIGAIVVGGMASRARELRRRREMSRNLGA